MRKAYVCEYCNKDFDRDEAADYFEENTFPHLNYDNLKPTLCGECAVTAVTEDLVDGIYFESCDKCGKKFDLIVANEEFQRANPGIDITDSWKDNILCADCAIEYFNNYYRAKEK